MSITTETIGNVVEYPNGLFSWWAEIHVEGVDECIRLDSAKNGTFFATKAEAEAKLIVAGRFVQKTLIEKAGVKNVTEQHNIGKLKI